MTEEVSKTQIDRLGDRLKKGNLTEADLRLLDDYRLSLATAHEIVIRTIQEKLRLEPTGRPAKSRTSISEKLRRESIRLTQIQDIAGCRLVVADVVEQDRVVESLTEFFAGTTIVDRRNDPSHGYRAVHVIVNCKSKLVEIQVRTALQHLWAELSEKFSDVVDPTIKYGGGDDVVRQILVRTSNLVGISEKSSLRDELSDEIKQTIGEVQADLQRLMLDLLRNLKGESNAVSD